MCKVPIFKKTVKEPEAQFSEFDRNTTTFMSAFDETTACFIFCGDPPANKSEGHIRKISSNAKKMIETANELRNLAGTGHGHVVGKEERLSADDASLVASSGLILAAWLLRHAEQAE